MRLVLLAVALSAGLWSASIEVVAGGGTALSGPARQVDLGEPFAVAFDRQGNWYVADYKKHRIFRITKQGEASVLAGTGEPGDRGADGPAAQMMLRNPHEVITGPDNTLYVADTFNHRVRAIHLKDGSSKTIAGKGSAGFSGDGGPAVQAEFHDAYAIALERGGKGLLLVDLRNRRVRRIDLRTGIVTTMAGNGQSGIPSDGAVAKESPLLDPRAIAVGRQGEIYLLDRKGNALRMIDAKGHIRTLIADNTGQPPMNGPKHLCVDRNGDVLIADTENHTIRRYSVRDKKLTTIVGTGKAGGRLVPNDPLQTELARPHGVTVGPDGAIYISDSENHRVLRLRP